MIERERTRVWCRRCAGYAEYNLGQLLKLTCRGQPGQEQDRNRLLATLLSWKKWCAFTKQTEDRKLKGPNKMMRDQGVVEQKSLRRGCEDDQIYERRGQASKQSAEDKKKTPEVCCKRYGKEAEREKKKDGAGTGNVMT